MPIKKKILFLLIILIGFFALSVGCKKAEEKMSPVGQILTGEHRLRKMMESAEINSKISGSYFLFMGGFEGESKTNVSVKFAWRMNDGIYAISSLPLTSFRVKFDENAKVPTIKFRWERSSCANNIQHIMDMHVYYAVITVRESDWPIDIKLPMNKR